MPQPTPSSDLDVHPHPARFAERLERLNARQPISVAGRCAVTALHRLTSPKVIVAANAIAGSLPIRPSPRRLNSDRHKFQLQVLRQQFPDKDRPTESAASYLLPRLTHLAMGRKAGNCRVPFGS